MKTLNKNVIAKSVVFVKELKNRGERAQKQICEHVVISYLIRDSILAAGKLHIFLVDDIC